MPYYFTEAQFKEVLESFGPLRSFELVKDRETGNSKAAFYVYQDVSVTDIACLALNGTPMGDGTLIVRRANHGEFAHSSSQVSNFVLFLVYILALSRIFLKIRCFSPTSIVNSID